MAFEVKGLQGVSTATEGTQDVNELVQFIVLQTFTKAISEKYWNASCAVTSTRDSLAIRN